MPRTKKALDTVAFPSPRKDVQPAKVGVPEKVLLRPTQSSPTGYSDDLGPQPLPDGLVQAPQGWCTAAMKPELIERAIDLSNQARTDDGGVDPALRAKVLSCLPSIDPVVPCSDKDLAALAGAALGLDPETLSLKQPGTPGFSGARVIIVFQGEQKVGVVKVSVPDDLIREISHDKLMRQAGFTNMPEVLAVAKTLGPDGTSPLAVEVMTIAPGEVIANEAWWAKAKENPDKVAAMLENMGARVGQLHSSGPKGQVDRTRSEALVCGKLGAAQLDRFLQGAKVEELVTQVPQMPGTGQNMEVGILEWISIMKAAPAVAASGLDFDRLEALARRLIPEFRADPGFAGWIHGDLQLGQMSVAEDDVTIFDRALMHDNMDSQGRPQFTTAYDCASLLVNVHYFARSAGFSEEQVTQMTERFWKGYERAGGQKPDEVTLAFLEVWRQCFVVSLFRDPTMFTPVPGGVDFNLVLKDMVFVLERALDQAQAALPG